jgi:hypothetical protein
VWCLTAAGDKTLLMLAKHYQHNLKKFVRFATTIPVGSGGSGSDVVVEVAAPVVDAVVVGAGLAGLTAALTLADRGGTVHVSTMDSSVLGIGPLGCGGGSVCVFLTQIHT